MGYSFGHSLGYSVGTHLTAPPAGTRCPPPTLPAPGATAARAASSRAPDAEAASRAEFEFASPASAGLRHEAQLGSGSRNQDHKRMCQACAVPTHPVRRSRVELRKNVASSEDVVRHDLHRIRCREPDDSSRVNGRRPGGRMECEWPAFEPATTFHASFRSRSGAHSGARIEGGAALLPSPTGGFADKPDGRGHCNGSNRANAASVRQVCLVHPPFCFPMSGCVTR